MKSQVMQIANRVRKYVCGMSNALRLAWKIVKCELLNLAFTVTWDKVSNGKERTATILSIETISIERDYVKFWESVEGGTFGEMQQRCFKFSSLKF